QRKRPPRSAYIWSVSASELRNRLHRGVAMTPVRACSICGGAIVGFGNDAWPGNNDRRWGQGNAGGVIPALRWREGDGKRKGSNGGGLQMIDLNDIEDDSFLAIHADGLRWLYDLWVQLANESRPLDRQAIAKRLADVLENAEFC